MSFLCHPPRVFCSTNLPMINFLWGSVTWEWLLQQQSRNTDSAHCSHQSEQWQSAHALGRAEVVFISFFHSNNLKTHISKGDTKAWQKTSVGFGILKSWEFCHCCHTHFLTDFFTISKYLSSNQCSECISTEIILSYGCPPTEKAQSEM